MRILLINYDNHSYVPFFPLGLAYLTSALEDRGHTVSIWDQAATHRPAAELTDLLNTVSFDVVGLGFIAGYFQYRQAKALSAAVNASTRRKLFKYVLGGHGPAAAPDYFKKKLGADTVFVGEAETSFPAYLDNRCVECGESKLIDPDDAPWPAYHRFDMNVYRLMRLPTSKTTEFSLPILSGRGCKWKCSFCYRMDEGFRARSPESVIEEMKMLWSDYRISHFQFADELFMSSSDRIQTFCEAMLKDKWLQKIPDFKWDCNGRLNYANNENLAIMRRAGCEYANYGIEALDDEVLRKIGKGLTVEQIKHGVERTLCHQISPGINFMWGNIGDTTATLERAASFILEYNPHHELRTIRPVTPYPGSKLFDVAVERGLCRGVEHFYEELHVNSDLLSVNFTDIPDEEFHRMLYLANLKLVKHHYKKLVGNINVQSYNLYHGTNPDFRGFRPI